MLMEGNICYSEGKHYHLDGYLGLFLTNISENLYEKKIHFPHKFDHIPGQFCIFSSLPPSGKFITSIFFLTIMYNNFVRLNSDLKWIIVAGKVFETRI